MELLGLGLLLLYVAAWREGCLGWLAALLMALIALVGGLLAWGAGAIAGGIAAVFSGIAGEDPSEAVREAGANSMMVRAVIGAMVGILPLAWRIWHAEPRGLMNDWEAHRAGTHPHRPTMGSAEDEPAGTAAPPSKRDPTSPPLVDQTPLERVSQAEITNGDGVYVRIEREGKSSGTANTSRSRRATKASRAVKSKRREARSEDTKAGS